MLHKEDKNYIAGQAVKYNLQLCVMLQTKIWIKYKHTVYRTHWWGHDETLWCSISSISAATVPASPDTVPHSKTHIPVIIHVRKCFVSRTLRCNFKKSLLWPRNQRKMSDSIGVSFYLKWAFSGGKVRSLGSLARWGVQIPIGQRSCSWLEDDPWH